MPLSSKAEKEKKTSVLAALLCFLAINVKIIVFSDQGLKERLCQLLKYSFDKT